MTDDFAPDQFPRGEEIAHAITHGLGALAAAAGLVILVQRAAVYGNAWQLVGVTVFGSTLLLLYTVSALYHAIVAPRAKFVFKLLDHAAIYLLIAGSSTPFALAVVHGPWGWTFFGLSWSLAILGILYEVVWQRPWKRLSLAFYLSLSWLVLLIARPLAHALPVEALVLLLAGGVAYSGGSVFYARRTFPYHHAVWHLFVLTGSALHWYCVLHYVLPVGGL